MASEEPKYQSKSEVIAVRLTPKMRFALEMHARLHHRSMGQAVERALERMLADDEEGLVATSAKGGRHNVLTEVWSVSPVIRLVRLAMLYPNLLTYEEEAILETINRARIYHLRQSAHGNERPEDGYDIFRIEKDWESILGDVSERLGGTLAASGKPVRRRKAKEAKD